MRNHFAPSFYLQGFSREDAGTLWVYHKDGATPFESTPDRVGFERNLYPDALEQTLTADIESPAHRILDRIRRRIPITADERLLFSKYIFVLWKRVPAMREVWRKSLPSQAKEYSKSIRSVMPELIAENPEKEEHIRTGAEVALACLGRIEQNPPDEIWQKFITYDSTLRTPELIASMKWAFLTTEQRCPFLTCDNPVFTLPPPDGQDGGEVSFPVSSTIMLWATARSDVPAGYATVPAWVARQMNGRTVRNARSFVYYPNKAAWIPRFLARGHWPVTRMTYRERALTAWQ